MMPWKHVELSLPGVSVQQLLEQHQPAVVDPGTTNTPAHPPVSEAAEDEEDVFQCGKCKSQFSSLDVFMGHKKICPLKNTTATATSTTSESSGGRLRLPSTSSSIHPRHVPSSLVDHSTSPSHLLLEPPSASLGSNVIHLNESDILSLTNSMGPSGGLSLSDNSNGGLDLGSSPQLSSSHPTTSSMLQSSSHTLSSLNTTTGDQHLMNTAPITSTSQCETGTSSGATTIGLPLSFVTGSGAFTLPGASILVTTSAGGESSNEYSQITIPSNVVFTHISNQQNSEGNRSSENVGVLVTQPQTQQQQPSLPSGPSILGHRNKARKKAASLQKSTSAGGGSKSSQQQPHSSNMEVIDLSAFGQQFQIDEGQSSSNSGACNSGEGSIGRKAAKLQCNFCGRAFNKNFDLQQHIRCHTGEKPFQCIVCGRAFAQKSNVKKHMQTHKVWPDGLAHTLPSNEEDNQDDLTHQIASSHHHHHHRASGSGVVPSSTHTRHGQTVGKKSSSTAGLLGIHRPDYMCPYCRLTAKTYFELKSHMKSHKREKVYKCIQSACGKMFSELDNFLEHIQIHESEMTYRCHLCPKTFSNLHDLGTHQFNHTLFPSQSGRQALPRYYRCQKCLNKYTTPAALEHHLATSTHHYPCSQCNKVFPCERYLRRHLVTHGAGLHECQYCDKTFKTANYLKVHLVIHTGAKPFTCNVCPAAFNRRDKLKRHKLVHDPVKKYKCPFRTHSGCNKEFNRPDKLKAHILTHSGVKPHPCNQCGRSFSRRAHLRAHLTAHVNSANVNSKQDEDDQMDDAQDSDGDVSDDMIDATTVHREESGNSEPREQYITFYDCSVCGSLFSTENDAKNHACVLSHHSVSINPPSDRVQEILPKRRAAALNQKSMEGSSHHVPDLTGRGLDSYQLSDSLTDGMDKGIDLNLSGYSLTDSMQTGLQPPLNLLNEETSKGVDDSN